MFAIYELVRRSRPRMRTSAGSASLWYRRMGAGAIDIFSEKNVKKLKVFGGEAGGKFLFPVRIVVSESRDFSGWERLAPRRETARVLEPLLNLPCTSLMERHQQYTPGFAVSGSRLTRAAGRNRSPIAGCPIQSRLVRLSGVDEAERWQTLNSSALDFFLARSRPRIELASSAAVDRKPGRVLYGISVASHYNGAGDCLDRGGGSDSHHSGPK